MIKKEDDNAHGEDLQGNGQDDKEKHASTSLSSKEGRLNETNKGYRMLVKMGWQVGTGLGANESGRVTPVVAVRRTERAGLGLKQKEERKKAVKRKKEGERHQNAGLSKAERKRRRVKEQQRDQAIARELYAPHLEGYEEYFM